MDLVLSKIPFLCDLRSFDGALFLCPLILIMMKQALSSSIVFVFLLSMGSHAAHAQFLKGIGKKLQDKVEQKINDQMDRRSGNKKNETPQKGEENQTAGGSKQYAHSGSLVQDYSKFDFIAGKNPIYLEDFSTGKLGELPLSWNANGKGEVVGIQGMPGRFLRLFPGTKYLTGNTSGFGDSFTIEFDILMDGTPPSGTRFLPQLKLGIFSSGAAATGSNEFLDKKPKVDNAVDILLKPNVDDISSAALTSTGSMLAKTFESGNIAFKEFSATIGKLAHYAIQVDQQRLRFWINEHKVFDAPRAVNLKPLLNQLYLSSMEYWPYNEENFKLYITNIRIAGPPEIPSSSLRSIGKYATANIFFETGADQIRMPSMGILSNIAQAMREDAALRLSIVGHTDGDGDTAANQLLSEKRAASVREVLIKNFGIEPSRLKSSGKGSSQPLSKANGALEKSMNRRVEFISW